jgi:8-oxo-dGTP diphosphatase
VVETGESLKDAIRREVLEETGLEVEPVSAAEVFERIMPGQDGRIEYHYVPIDYLCKVSGGELASLNITAGTLDVIERVLSK